MLGVLRKCELTEDETHYSLRDAECYNGAVTIIGVNSNMCVATRGARGACVCVWVFVGVRVCL